MDKLEVYKYNRRYDYTLRKTIEGYDEVPNCYRLNDGEIEILRSLKNWKSDPEYSTLYFVPQTRFKRSFVETKLEDTKVVRSPQKADVIVFDSADIRIVDKHIFITKDPQRICLNKPKDEYYEDIYRNFWKPYGYELAICTKLLELWNEGYRNFMTLSRLYGQSEFINHDKVTPEFLISLMKQLRVEDESIRKIGRDILVSLNPHLFGDIICTIIGLSRCFYHYHWDHTVLKSDLVDNFRRMRPQWFNISPYLIYRNKNMHTFLNKYGVNLTNPELVQVILEFYNAKDYSI